MEVIDKWAAEFLIRSQSNPKVSPTNLLSALQLGDSSDCLKLKISSVLRDISNSLIRGTLNEETLDLLEILEKLLLQKNSLLMESHKSAYCWTAAECTLRFMWPLAASDGFFTDAIERIWKKRIGILKDSGSNLVTQDLLKWETDMNKALKDPDLYQRIRETNIRYTAVSFLNQLLKEQWELLGNSSLESIAQKKILKRNSENIEGDPNDANEVGGTGEGENGNGINREKANDVEGMGCLKNDGIDKVNGGDEELKMDAQEREHEPSLDKGDQTAAQQLKNYLLEIQGHIDPNSRQGEETNNGNDQSVDVTPKPARGRRTRTGGQDHNEAPDSVNENGSNSLGLWSSRVRPRLLTPVPLNVSPLKKASPHVRRPKKFWTPEEVEALRAGVKEYGKSWKDIKNANPVVLAERTEVDLKDKWRNLSS